ncbi:hypothetical protein [Spirosoma fluviale]|uniref:Glycosyl transferase family 11 n=1 Tax=Spirosoma fluviale TaxID=1597977 RepID=A0A286GRX7_9BACT|nr:hypothetical protein [Spirosoma fluviale]SOD98321.1 hypothetical protein SAMN06269250_6024 [Spirosoma fluviale]
MVRENIFAMLSKIKSRLWSKIVVKFRYTSFYPFLYNSYWHYKLNKNNVFNLTDSNYYSAIPNRGAGVGHQLANWNAGYWYAHYFGLKFSHTPFSTKSWEDFLGFGEDEVQTELLLNTKGYTAVRLPLFDENKREEIELTKRIIHSYKNKKVVFIAEQDQFYKEQFGVCDAIKKKFYAALAREKNQLVYDENVYNVAIHIRRGDITIGQKKGNTNHIMRWQDNNYFEHVLNNVLKHINTDKEVKIYLFSQGNLNDFKSFIGYKNLTFCLDMSGQDSFLHMVYADLLITSKSSFSYKPALLNNGIKVCPRDFWHSYPSEKDWIIAEEDGTFNSEQIKKLDEYYTGKHTQKL